MKQIDFDNYKKNLRYKNLYLNGLIWTDLHTKESFYLKVDKEEIDNINNILLLSEEETLFFLEDRKLLDIYKHKRKESNLIRKTTNQIINKIKWKVFRRDNFTCVYCGANDEEMTYDHYIPTVLGGTTTVENGRTSCGKCNNIKGDMSPEEWEIFRKEL